MREHFAVLKVSGGRSVGIHSIPLRLTVRFCERLMTTSKSVKQRSEYTCYRCGSLGHIAETVQAQGRKVPMSAYSAAFSLRAASP